MNDTMKFEDLIIKTLKDYGTLSTYKISKYSNISYSMVNLYCFKLKSEEKLNMLEVKRKVGNGLTRLWSLK